MKRWVVETRTYRLGCFITGWRPSYSYSLHRWRWSARLRVWVVTNLCFSDIARETARITGRVTIWRRDDPAAMARWTERYQEQIFRHQMKEWERPRTSAIAMGQMAAWRVIADQMMADGDRWLKVAEGLLDTKTPGD